jgi:hypothetical protein
LRSTLPTLRRLLKTIFNRVSISRATSFWIVSDPRSSALPRLYGPRPILSSPHDNQIPLPLQGCLKTKPRPYAWRRRRFGRRVAESYFPIFITVARRGSIQRQWQDGAPAVPREAGEIVATRIFPQAVREVTSRCNTPKVIVNQTCYRHRRVIASERRVRVLPTRAA